MNIEEVYTLNDNLEGAYAMREYTVLYMQTRGHMWYLQYNEIKVYNDYDDYDSYIPQGLSKRFLDWVFE